jgi:hypothetical protein
VGTRVVDLSVSKGTRRFVEKSHSKFFSDHVYSNLFGRKIQTYPRCTLLIFSRTKTVSPANSVREDQQSKVLLVPKCGTHKFNYEALATSVVWTSQSLR